MNMNYFIKTILSILIVALGFSNLQAQDPYLKEHIQNLKNGVLLVKLYTRNNVVDALKERGRDEEAQNIEREQKFKNLAIANAFKNQYHFSPLVYFFYSDDSKKIMNKEFEDVLMDYNLQKFSSTPPMSLIFYVAEFGNTEDMDINALVIKDHEFNELRKPFPYYVKTFEGWWIFKRTYNEVVMIWNEKLFQADEKGL